MSAQLLADELARHGLRDAVISPGSRNAPLVLAFWHHPDIRVIVAGDERSAAHVALGLACQTRRPAAVISTSGTAAVNHGPAIAEARFAGTPLISITADRPAAVRHAGHGQTAYQPHLFANHVLFESELDEIAHDAATLRAQIAAGWQAALRGPVHFNVPLAEPLYGLTQRPHSAAAVPAVSAAVPATAVPVSAAVPPVPDPAAPAAVPAWSEGDWRELLCGDQARVLVHAGPMPHDAELADLRETLLERCALLADVLSPLAGDGAESSADRWMRAGAPLPDVILTLGGPPMSKAFRQAIAAAGIPHWHLGDDGLARDVFGHLRGVVPGSPAEALAAVLESMPGFNTYAADAKAAAWGLEDRHRRAVAEAGWSDLVVWDGLARAVPEGAVVHLANSTAARYAQLAPWRAERLHANRGVAGIDGCASTAVGDALAHPDRQVVLVTGDQAFFYDLNGFWVKPMPRNLCVIVINNGGGGIFRWLPGPAESGLLESCFEADLGRKVAGAAASVGAEHRAVGEEDWEAGLAWVLEPGTQRENTGGLRLLEVKTGSEESAAEYARYMTVWSTK